MKCKKKRKKGADIINEIHNLLFKTSFQEYCKIKKTYFKKTIKLPMEYVIAIIVNGLSKSLQIELRDFLRYVQGQWQRVSKQAFSKARKKLSHEAFILMNKKLVLEFYSDNSYKTWKDYRLLGIDGSTVQLPNSEEIIKEFGMSSNQHGELPMGKVSVVYDVENDIAIDSIINRYKKPNEMEDGKTSKLGERDLAICHIQKIKEMDQINTKKMEHDKDLFLFDMGYPSLSLMTFIQFSGKDYVMRCSDFFVKETQNAIANKKRDQIIEIPLKTEGRPYPPELKDLLPDLPQDTVLKIRILQIPLEGGKQETLLTTLIDIESFPYEDFKELYAKRWGSEINYAILKNILQIENFTGYSAISIRQDFHATVFTNNIRGLIHWDLQEEIDKENQIKDRKYDYKINNNTSVGFLKNKIITLLLEKGDFSEFYEDLKNEIRQELVPIRPGRSSSRKRRKGHKYKMNRKRAI